MGCVVCVEWDAPVACNGGERWNGAFLMLESLEVRADDEGKVKTIAGYAAVSDKLSVVMWGFREKIAPGAFREVAEGGCARCGITTRIMCWGARRQGRWWLDEDGHGLKVEIDPPGSAAGFVEY